MDSLKRDMNKGSLSGTICHAPTLSQARDNSRVNPSGVNNTFLELANDFQTPVHTYNPLITGECITKSEKRNTTRCVYIYIYQRFMYLQTYNQTDPFYTKMFNTTCYYKEFIYTICFKGNAYQELQQNISSCPAQGE